MDFSKYLFRCHMVGKIIDVPKPLTPNQKETLNAYIERRNGIGRPLTDRQEKDYISLQNKKNESEVYSLSEGTKSILSELVYAETYGRKIDINSPKISKGLEVEKEGRDILTRVSGLFLTANRERKKNDWVTGIIDIEPQGVIIDIKSSWSWSSFAKILQDKPNEIYLRQGDSYMDLWGCNDFLLCHILTDTPFKLIDGELRSLDYKNDVQDMEGNIREDSIDEVKRLITNHIFSRKALEDYCQQSPSVMIEWFNDFVEIPEHKRVHMIPHKFDKVRIEQRNECIKLAREYMKTCEPINNFNKTLLSNENNI